MLIYNKTICHSLVQYNWHSEVNPAITKRKVYLINWILKNNYKQFPQINLFGQYQTDCESSDIVFN